MCANIRERCRLEGRKMKCKKCGRTLNDCQSCNGGRASGFMGAKLNCSKCSNTGLVCSQHGGFWK